MIGHEETLFVCGYTVDEATTSDNIVVICDTCGEAYLKLKKCPDSHRCKHCIHDNRMTPEKKTLYDKAYYEANKESIAEKQTVYREANKESIAEKRTVYREANKELITARQKAHYEANKESIAEKRKAHYEANKESIAEKRKAYREANEESLAEKRKAHYEANKESVAEKRKAYREANKELMTERQQAYYYNNLDKEHARSQKRYADNPDKERARCRAYYESNKETIRKQHTERRTYLLSFSDPDFTVLNEWFEGCEGHHLSWNAGIYIPKKIHRSVYHSNKSMQGMEKINTLAFEWLDGVRRDSPQTSLKAFI